MWKRQTRRVFNRLRKLWILTHDSAKKRIIRVTNYLNGGLPIPPGKLIYLVLGSEDVSWFLSSGKLGVESMQDILNKNGLLLDEFEAILDFGCGAGRVMRHLHNINGPALFGTDYNPELIAWCHKNLKFADFQTNPLVGSLEYKDECFDFIYALSVFTHLSEPQQDFWIKELCRVLKPGGYLFITVHGREFYLPQILTEDRERFLQGELVVYGGDEEGSNICTAFHPEEYVRQKMAKGLIVVDFVPEGAAGNPRQDVYLFQKPALSFAR